MNAFGDFLRGLRAAFTLPSLSALLWSYLACAAVAVPLLVTLYMFVSGTVMSSAMAFDLRQGLSADWLIDLVARPGSANTALTLFVLALLLAPAYLVLAVFASGGCVSHVRRALFGPESVGGRSFLAACGAFAGPMSRIAIVEVVAVAIVVAVFAVVRVVLVFAHVPSVLTLVVAAVALAVLAIVTALFDYARIALVARGDKAALASIGDGMRGAARSIGSVVALAMLNLVVGVAAFALFFLVRDAMPRSTGLSLVLALLVGQLTVLARLWSRLLAYASETALWSRSAVP